MAKSKNSLLADIESMPNAVDPNTRRAWYWKLSQEDPAKYAELLEVARDWINGGIVRQKFASKTTLHCYLSGNDRERLCDPPIVSCNATAFKEFMKGVESGSIN